MKTVTLYHATDWDSWKAILRDGCIKPSLEGVVYCCERKEDCIKFIALRNLGVVSEPFVVIEIQAPADAVEETFDHSERFFKCRCYGIWDGVPLDWITKVTKYASRTEDDND